MMSSLQLVFCFFGSEVMKREKGGKSSVMKKLNPHPLLLDSPFFFFGFS